jgi:riboflavin biosynthesis pyrimidine reductase
MIPSVDGRITGRWNLPKAAHGCYEKTAATFKADAWIVGRISMAPYANGKPAKTKWTKVPAGDFIAPHKDKKFAIALDPSGKLVFKKGYIDEEHVIAVITERAGEAHKACLRDRGVSYIIGGREEINLRAVLQKLHKNFGIDKLLLEGGGKINGSFLRAGLIDELSLLVAPAADGTNETPSLFDCGPKKRLAARLKLLCCKALPGCIVWLRYKLIQ